MRQNIVLFATFLLAVTIHTYFFDLPSVIALNGFSALEVLESQIHPQNFLEDFPGGSRITTRASLITFLYYPIHQVTGLSGLMLIQIMIALEILAVMWGSFMLWRVLVPEKTGEVANPLYKWGYVWLTLFMITGNFIRPNLPAFAQPYFHGQFYGFADGLSLAAIAFAIRYQWKRVALVLMLCFTIHPIKTVMTGAFIAIAAVVDHPSTFNRKSVIAGLATTIFVGLWSYFWVGLGQHSAGQVVSLSDFTSYTRIFQYHWYPIDAGYFTSKHNLVASPFFGTLLLCFLALKQSAWSPLLIRQFLKGLLGLLLIGFFGLWVSVDLTSVTLIQICFLRATTLMALLAPFIVLPTFLEMLRAQKWHWAAFYFSCLVGTFVSQSSMGPAWIVVGIVFYLMETKKFDFGLVAAAMVAAMWTAWLWRVYSNNLPDVAMTLVLAGSAYVVFKFTNYRVGLITFIFLLGSFQWGRVAYQLPESQKAKATDYMNVQLWAKDHTPPEALFMVDPCERYGWRDFSVRSSIGTPIEWFMTGWVYMNDNRVLQRGKAIAAALGLEMTKHLSSGGENNVNRHKKVCKDARKKFYDPTHAGLKKLSSQFGVDFFVMLKSASQQTAAKLSNPPVFENSTYLVYAASDIGD